MSVLITGGTGTLGRELVKVYPDSVHPSHAELDIGNGAAVDAFLKKARPSMVIHCAALTGVRQCEEDKARAWRVNVEGTENLLHAAKKFSKDSYFLLVSTPCVFWGDKGDYVESDLPYPKNYYALTKLLGEAAVRHSGLERWLIVRTNFVGRAKWPYPKAFVDRYGTYLFADDVAKAIKEVASKEMEGIVHITGDRRLSMFELARMTTPGVEPMSLAGYQGPPLTVDMTLKSERIPPLKINARETATA